MALATPVSQRRTQRRRDVLLITGWTTVAAVFVIGALSLGGGLPSFKHSYQVKVVLPTAASLTTGARVTMAGVAVGEVKGVALQGVGSVATLALHDKRVYPLPSDTIVQLRQRSPLGENFVALVPGKQSASRVPDGGVLGAARADDYVDVDQILSVFQGKTRNRVRTLLTSLGSALDDQGKPLNRVIAGGLDIAAGGSGLVARLDRDRDHVGRLIARFGSVAQALGDRGQAIKGLVNDGRTTFRALAESDQGVRRLARALPGTLKSVRRTTTTLRTASRDATPVLSELAGVVRDVRPTVGALPGATSATRAALDDLDAATPQVNAALRRVRRLSPLVRDASPKLERLLCETNPLVHYLKPYIPDVVQVLNGLGAASNAYDATGHTIRLLPMLGDNSLGAAPPAVNDAAQQFLHTGLFGKQLGLTWGLYEKPGRVGVTTAENLPYVKGPANVPASGYVYPRVKAAC